MAFNRLKKIALVGCMAAAVTCTGCMSMGDIYNMASNEQTTEDGDDANDKKSDEDKDKKDSDEDGYEVKYSGKICGNATDITVYGDDGKTLGSGAGEFEWISDSVVKVTYSKKDKKGNVTTLIADQDKVVIKMVNKDKDKDEDKDSENSKDEKESEDK